MGGDGINLVVDENGQFKEDNFNTAMDVLAIVGEASKGDQKGRKGGHKGDYFFIALQFRSILCDCFSIISILFYVIHSQVLT